MTDWVMYGRDGNRLGMAADWADFDPEAVMVLKETPDGVAEMWLFRRWAPASLLNMDGMGHESWIRLHGTIRLGEFGGGRMFWGDRAFVRQVDLGPNFAWLVPHLVQLPALVGPTSFLCGGQTVWAWQSAGKRYYLFGDGPRWGLYGAGNTPEEHLKRMESDPSWAHPTDFLMEAGALRLSQRF